MSSQKKQTLLWNVISKEENIMDNDNRGLLTEVIAKNLNCTLNAEQGSEEEKTAFKHAMEAIDRENRMSKDDDAYRESTSKLDAEKERIQLEKERIQLEKEKIEFEKQHRISEDEFKRKEAKKAWMFRAIEIGVIYAASPLLDSAIKKGFAKMCMVWERDNTFTTTPGRSIKDFFRFKK